MARKSIFESEKKTSLLFILHAYAVSTRLDPIFPCRRSSGELFSLTGLGGFSVPSKTHNFPMYNICLRERNEKTFISQLFAYVTVPLHATFYKQKISTKNLSNKLYRYCLLKHLELFFLYTCHLVFDELI